MKGWDIMQETVNEHAIKAAKDLLNYLSETAGKAIITGQHTQTKPMEEIEYVRSVTGKEPALRGFELLSYSPNINYKDAGKDCLTEVYENRGTVETAIKWAKETKGIVALSFHWFSPIGGHDKSFYAKNTDFDAEKILKNDSPERTAFYNDMDVIAHELKKFQQADIPVLWRPFHEADGDWFWWGAKGPVVAGKLYIEMYEYYTNVLHLDNLIWVWNCPVKEAYPGDEYVDIVSVDIYLKEYEKTDYHEQYEQLIKATSSHKIAALAEVGYMPDIELLEKSHVRWTYYMTWSKEFCIGEQYNTRECLKKMYNSSYAKTEKTLW